MNKENNARKQSTKKKIYNALMYLLKHKSFNQIYVKDICAVACINRSSFYEHYQDINDLMIQTESYLSKQMKDIFKDPSHYDNACFVKMFEFIKDNKEFYTAYLTNNDASFMEVTDFKSFISPMKNSKAKYTFSETELIYHMAFFAAGLKAICKVWLKTGLQESPEQLAQIIAKEYQTKSF